MRTLAASALLAGVIVGAGRYAAWRDARDHPALPRLLRHSEEYDGREIWVPVGRFEGDRLVVGDDSVGLLDAPGGIADGSSVGVRGTWDAAAGAIHVAQVEIHESWRERLPVEYALSAAVVLWVLWRMTGVFRPTIGPGRMIVRR